VAVGWINLHKASLYSYSFIQYSRDPRVDTELVIIITICIVQMSLDNKYKVIIIIIIITTTILITIVTII
jgi:hypothetical protein